ncbi:myeloperoxidase-like [Lingula anatina]|uniref:Myeloperoxidase-like n=1 Tax=Lingula anatina TaxID=7574 RepID=A0A1S3IJP8_LINAN|nr:myeloperoxidase-like [Lingula anatina]|eukprot:XP_013398465.1 myeloperoxidase-like [Lingula anatina]
MGKLAVLLLFISLPLIIWAQQSNNRGQGAGQLKNEPGDSSTGPNSSILHKKSKDSKDSKDSENGKNCTSAKDSKFRTADGTCNNLENKEWGSAGVAFDRLGPISYEDGIKKPRKFSVVFRRGKRDDHQQGDNDDNQQDDDDDDNLQDDDDVIFMGRRRRFKLPGPRAVSLAIHTGNEPALDNRALSLMVMQWGQFLDHDITLTLPVTDENGDFIHCCPKMSNQSKACLPIKIDSSDPTFEEGCMSFVRSAPSEDSRELGYREQFNVNTAFIDASNVYGSGEQDFDRLRNFTGGLLKVFRAADSDRYLPWAETEEKKKLECQVREGKDICFAAGDVRVNEQPGLTAMHTTWLYEHNRIARALSKLNPQWNDERLFQEARRILGAMMQHITYNEFLPIILGESGMTTYGLKVKPGAQRSTYNSAVNPTVVNEFSAAAYRFGHSLLQNFIPRFDQETDTDNLRLRDNFFCPFALLDSLQGGVKSIINGLLHTHPQKVDNKVTEEVTNHLFENTVAMPGFDLVSLNIQRGRDHGLPSYNTMREACGLEKATDFDGLQDLPERLRTLYHSVYRHVDDIDLWTAGVSEIPRNDGLLGPTFSCIIGQQFRRLKYGDRYFYQHSGETGLTEDQLLSIKGVLLSRVMCENTGITQVQKQALKAVGESNPYVDCNALPGLDLSPWKE